MENDLSGLPTEILCVRFNQDFSSIAFGTNKGFCIYNLNPLVKNIERSKY